MQDKLFVLGNVIATKSILAVGIFTEPVRTEVYPLVDKTVIRTPRDYHHLRDGEHVPRGDMRVGRI